MPASRENEEFSLEAANSSFFIKQRFFILHFSFFIKKVYHINKKTKTYNNGNINYKQLAPQRQMGPDRKNHSDGGFGHSRYLRHQRMRRLT